MKYPVFKVRNNLYHYRAALWRTVLTSIYGMDIGDNTRISSKAKLDFTNPKGLHIGPHTSVSFNVAILTHDFVNRKHVDTYVGSHCFIGAGTIVLPGVRIGDHCIIGAGSVVMSDIPAGSIASGNPARVVRSGVSTTEYGILVDDAPPAVTPAAQAEDNADPVADQAAVKTLIETELNVTDTATFDAPLTDGAVDSFDLISLRTALEERLGKTIPDSEWSTIGALADIPALPCLSGANPPRQTSPQPPEPVLPEPSAASDEGDVMRPDRAHRAYRINMPQMALSGLSEAWLFKELGDLHWGMITTFLKTPSSAITDASGDRLYATFTRIRLRAEPSLRAFRENAALDMSSGMSRFGASLFFGAHDGTSADATISAQTMSSFAKYGEKGRNTTLLKGTPDIPCPEDLPSLDASPAFAQEYRDKRAALPNHSLFDCDFKALPPHHINGVGLIYFAAYPSIFDLCLAQHEGDDFLFQTSTVTKDIYYFANAEPTERLHFQLHKRETHDGHCHHAASILRDSDGKRMAYIESEKRIL